MTTTVTIEAHCADDTEVVVSMIENGEEIDSAVIQDGSSISKYVYDSREIIVKEVLKDKMKQLCTSRISEGVYDGTITSLIRDDSSDEEILLAVMIKSRGLENPAMVETRIQYIRKDIAK